MANEAPLWKCPFCETLTPHDETLKECPQCGYLVRTGCDKASQKLEKTAVLQQKKADSLMTICILFGLYLLVGAAYQVFYQESFPLFPIQIDGILIFTQLFGDKTALYISSLIVALIGAFSFWLGLYALKTAHRSAATKTTPQIIVVLPTNNARQSSFLHRLFA